MFSCILFYSITGERVVRHNDRVMVMVWKDRKVVRMVSTRHTDTTREVQRWNRVDTVVDGRRRKSHTAVCTVYMCICCGDATIQILLPIPIST